MPARKLDAATLTDESPCWRENRPLWFILMPEVVNLRLQNEGAGRDVFER